MNPFQFSPESELFAANYSLIEEIEGFWKRDCARCFEELFGAVERGLERTLTAVVRSNGYRYWWPATSPKDRAVVLWYSTAYIEVLKARKLLWWAYLGEGDKFPTEAERASWQGAAVAECRIDGVTLEPVVDGNKYKTLRVEMPWAADPVSDCAPKIVRVFKELEKARGTALGV